MAKKKKCYYAHPMSLYGTPQENRDIVLLENLGFTAINPNEKEHIQAVRNMGRTEAMLYFIEIVKKCDMIAFRSFPDGRISSGVAMEVTEMVEAGKPVIELPCGLIQRALGIAETVERLRDLGQR